MTKRREPLTYEHALTEVAARIGWDNAAALCGVSERTVRYWSDPDCQKEIRLIDADRLDRAFLADGGSYAPFHRMMALRLDLASTPQAGANLALATATAAKETGEAIAAMVNVTAHPEDARARSEARRETQEAIVALTEELAALDALERSG